MIRAFVAIEISEAIRRQLMEHSERFKREVPIGTVRWARLEGIHLTLKFLGDLSLSKVDQIAELLEGVGDRYSPFAVEIGSFGCFPNLRRPRVLWIGVKDPSGKIASLHADLERELSHIGFERDNRSFHPHLTLGRVKRSVDRSTNQSLSKILETVKIGKIGQLYVDSIYLIRSDLKSTGAVYTKLASVKLESGQ